MHAAPVRLESLALEFPPYRLAQADVARKAAEIFGASGDLIRRMAKSYENAGVRNRASCVPLDWYGAAHGWPERMRLFEENALALLAAAGAEALAKAGVAARDVAAIVTVSSTGIATPSLDSSLQTPLGLAPTVQRLPVFGLGCAGGVLGLARAAAMARAIPGRPVLFLCVELCGLTFRASDTSKANIIGTALFGDGAAAAVLRVDPSAAASAPELRAWGEHTWPDTADVMGWRIEEDGLGVVFSRDIPTLVRERMRAASDAFLAVHGLDQDDIAGLIPHPGGEKVVEALEACYALAPGSLADARSTLADHGNMSAVTVLAVLDRALARGAAGRHLMAALGPGFSAGFAVIDLPGA
jgi:alkylresorcinol/alkylpyrone synthase